jgi:hypothetical protein
MRIAKSGAAIAAVGLLVVACGGAVPPTQNPGNGGTPTQNPGGGGATTNPGGGGADTSKGKVHIEITGPITKSGDYGYVPAASVFGGAQGASMSFTDSASTAVVTIATGADNQVVVTWGTPEFSTTAECTTQGWTIGSNSGSGTFDCTGALVILANGTMGQEGHVTGSFDAHP